MPVSDVPPLLFGLTFASPEWLAGLLLIGIPILLHWQYRRPVREERWAAMDLLRRALARRSQRLRLQTLLLLAVRMLLIAAAVLAFSRPMLSSPAGNALARRAVDRVLVLDATMSMQSQESGPQLFDRAKEMAKQIVASAQPGDSFRVAVIAPRGPVAAMRQRSSDLIAVAGEIDRLQPTDTFDAPFAVLNSAMLSLDAAPTAPPEVIVISDFQRANWEPSGIRGSSTDRPLTLRPGQLQAIAVGNRQVENLAVAEVEFDPPLLRPGQSVNCSVVIQNPGRSPRQDVIVEVLIDGTVRGVARTDVPASGRAIASLPLTFDRAGDQAVEARIGTDSLLADNAHFQVVRVREELRILLVDVGPAPNANNRPSDFLRLALAPPGGESSSPASETALIRQIDDVQLARENLSQWDCVFLCGLPRITADEARQLQQFVSRGGGLIVGGGPGVDVENWNGLMFQEGAGPLPARMAGWHAGSLDAPATLQLGETPHRILDPFVGNPDAGLTTTRVWESLSIEPPVAAPLLTFSDNRSALVEKRFGRGVCLLCALSFDGRGNNWPLWPSYLPLVQEMLAHVVTASDPRAVAAGQPLEFQPPRGLDVTLLRPDGRSDNRRVSPSTDRTFIVTDTQDAGIYSLTSADAGSLEPNEGERPATMMQVAAVNADPRESDLDRLDVEEIRALFPGARVVAPEDWRPSLPTESSSHGAERGLARPLLAALLALLLVETLLTWRFHWGIGLLAGLLTAAALWSLAGPAQSIVAGLVIGVTMAWGLQRKGGAARPGGPPRGPIAGRLPGRA